MRLSRPVCCRRDKCGCSQRRAAPSAVRAAGDVGPAGSAADGAATRAGAGRPRATAARPVVGRSNSTTAPLAAWFAVAGDRSRTAAGRPEHPATAARHHTGTRPNGAIRVRRTIRADQAGAAGVDRPEVSNQSGDGAATGRRPTADRRGRAGQRVDGRSATHPRQGHLDSHAQCGLRLHAARRRRPGLQQGHHDRPLRELFLRRWRPDHELRPD